MATQEQVLDALKKVRFPGLSRDIVSFGFVHDVKIDGGNVAFTVHFQSENPSVAQQISREAEAAVRALPGVTDVKIGIDVVARQAAGPAAGTSAPSRILPGVKYTIAVASGKGGVGKSTVSTNLALAIRALGYTVGLLDADIYGPSQQMMLGIEGRPTVGDDEKIIPMENHGIKTMSLGLITSPDEPVIWRGPMVMKALDQFLTDVNWGTLDFMILDLPPRHRRCATDADAESAPHRRGRRDDTAGRGTHRRAQGAGHVPQGERAGARHRREHELLHLPALR